MDRVEDAGPVTVERGLVDNGICASPEHTRKGRIDQSTNSRFYPLTFP